MPSPCNNLNVVPIKVSQLARYSNIDVTDYFLTIESGSALYSRKSTFGDLVNAFRNVTGSYSGSFSGSYFGSILSKKTVASGSFSGSYWGKITSKNAMATGSFRGTNSHFTGTNNKFSGSFSGSYFGGVVSKNTKATGSFSGSYFGGVISKNTNATGSFSGSYFGNVISKNTKATGSFSGINNKLSGSFSGSSYGRFIGKNSLISGSFRGIDNITNFKGTGKKVSFNGTSSYSVSSSFAATASYAFIESTYENVIVNTTATPGTPSTSGNLYQIQSITVPTGKTLKWFRIEGSLNVSENNSGYIYGVEVNGSLISSNIYSSWGWGNGYNYNPDSGNVITHFTIEGISPITTGTLTFSVRGSADDFYGYVIGYY